MSATTSETPSTPRPLWLDAFTMRLGELAPALSPVDAQRFAEQTFDDAVDLDPLEAAEVFALEMPPADEGAP